MIKLITDIQAAIYTPSRRSAWFGEDTTRIYLRFGGAHILPDRPAHYSRCIDIASVTVEETKQGQGQFTLLLEAIEAAAAESQYPTVYVENVLTERFARFFGGRGYTRIQLSADIVPPSFYKRVGA